MEEMSRVVNADGTIIKTNMDGTVMVSPWNPARKHCMIPCVSFPAYIISLFRSHNHQEICFVIFVWSLANT